MAKMAIVYDIVRQEEKMLTKEASERGFEVAMLNLDHAYFNLSSKDNLPYDVALQRSISYFRSLHSTKVLEDFGVRVINSFYTTLISGNKLFTTLALEKAGVPTPKTFLAFSEEQAIKATNELGYPAVLKPVVGSWGRLVSALNDEESAKAILESRKFMHPLYQIYYVQKRIIRPPRDIRSYVIGDQYVTAIYRYSPPGDWRTNTAISGRAEPCPKSKELEDLSIKAAKAVNAEYIGVDFMESQNGLVVHEVNSSTEFKNTVRVTGVNIPKLIVDHIYSLIKR